MRENAPVRKINLFNKMRSSCKEFTQLNTIQFHQNNPCSIGEIVTNRKTSPQMKCILVNQIIFFSSSSFFKQEVFGFILLDNIKKLFS